MKSKFLNILIGFVFVFGLICSSGIVCAFAGGNGTFASPYQISNWTDLNNTRLNLTAYYVLIANLSSLNSDYTGIGNNWTPIGNQTVGFQFTGNFNGNNNTISDLTIKSSNVYIGLFGYAAGNISNIGLINVNVSGNNYVGALVGAQIGVNSVIINSYSTGNVNGNGQIGGLVGQKGASTYVFNSYSTSNVRGTQNVGGLVGYLVGTINNSYATGNLSGSSVGVGGLVGYSPGGTVTNSYATGNVNSSSSSVGGLVGTNSGTISNSYSRGNVFGSGDVGGLAGGNNGGTINNSYATGNVTSSGIQVGGLVGNITSGIITSCYATGNALGTQKVGGLVGSGADTIINNSYSTGNANATTNTAGGLVGDLGAGNIYNSFSTGRPNTLGTYVGGLVGNLSTGTAIDSYWDNQTSGISVSPAGIGKTTAQMISISTFSSWSIGASSIRLNNGYPYLAWQAGNHNYVWLIGVPPLISFINPTPPNNSFTNHSNFIINISSSDANPHYSFVDFDKSLVAWWRMEQGNGTFFNDDTGGNNGTCSGTACPIFNPAGKFGGTYSFDGVNSYISANDISNFANQLSFGGWFKRNSLAAQDLIGQLGSTTKYLLSLQAISSWMDCYVYNATTVAQVDTAPPVNINDGNWHQIFCVYNGTNVILYVDGNQYGSTPSLTGNIKTGTQNVGIGARSAGGNKFNGSIDDVLIFNRSLSVSEIKSLYNSSANQYYNNFTNLVQGQHNFIGYAIDAAGNKNQTEARIITIDLTPPSIVIYSPENKTYTGNSIFLNFSASDASGIDKCWYKIDGSPSIIYGCTANISGLSDGEQYITVYANDTAGNVNSSVVYFTIASSPPTWSNIRASFPASYSVSSSFFNVTWNSLNGISSVLFESNFSGIARNYSMTDLGGGVYGFNAALPAGNFYWRSYVNDSYGNSNSTPMQIININKSSNIINFYLNGILNNNISAIYGNFINASASALGSISLYRDGIAISNPDAADLAAGIYNYTATVADSQNYSGNSSSYFVSINKQNTGIKLLLNGNENDLIINYGNYLNVTAIGENATLTLYKDGLQISNPSLTLLSAGEYNYTAIIEENENLTGAEESFIATIGKTSPNLNLLMDGLPIDKNITYGSMTNVSSYESNIGDGDITYSLYRNGELIEGGSENKILPPGVYIYNYSSSGGENYTSNAIVRTLIVSKKNPAISLLINGKEEDKSMIYGENMNITASISDGRKIELLRNGELLGDDNLVFDNAILKAGVYNYTAIFEGDENYSAAEKSFVLGINKSTPSLTLLLNGESSDLSVPIYSLVEIEAYLNTPQIGAHLYENGALIDSGISFSEERNYTSLGDRNWTLVFEGDENYTNKSISYFVSVLDPDFPQYSNLKRSPASPTSFSTSKSYTFNSTWTDNVGIDEVLFEFDGKNYSFNKGEISRNGNEYYIHFTGIGVGSYNYKWFANDTSGNLVASPTQSYTIEKGIAALFLTVSPGSNIIYGTTSSVGCSANNLESSPILTRNIDVVNNPDTAVLGAGSYNYACTCIATANYTSASTTTTLTVEKASPLINIKLNNQSNNLNLQSGSNVTIYAELTSPGIGNLTLIIDGENASFGESPLSFSNYFNSGTHLINALFDGNANYSSGGKSVSVTVTIPSGTGGGNEGSGGSGGGSSVPAKSYTEVKAVNVDISNPGDVVFSPGESKSLSVSIKNKGVSFLNNCRLVSKGNYSSWISGKTNKGLAAGEIADFVFSLNAPSDASPGDYNVGVALQCKEGEYEEAFNVTIVQAKLNLKINEIKTQVGMLEISYSLQDLSESRQNISLEFSLVDDLNVEVVKDSKIIDLNSGETKDENIIMTIPEDLAGEYTLILNAESDLASVSSSEKVLLGGTTTTGFALLSQEGQRIVPIVIVIIALLILGYFFIRRVFKSRFINKGEEGGVIKIGPKHKKGVMIIDSAIIEHIKRHAESHDVNGKWIHLSAKKESDSS